MKLVQRKNTEVLGANHFNAMANSPSKVNVNTLKQVMDIQENLNVTIQKQDVPNRMQMMVHKESQDSILDQMNSLENTVYKQFNHRTGQDPIGIFQDSGFQAALEDAQTLE